MPSFHSLAEIYFVPLQLALAMLGMGATLSVREFGSIARDPRGLAIGLVLQLVVVPGIAVGFISAFDMSPGWAVGLILVAAVPGGAFSNLLTYLGRGNVPLSISVTVASTSACILTVPLLLRLLAGSYLPAEFTFPLERIIVEIFAYLLVPLAIGMLIYRRWGRGAVRLSRWSIRASLLLIVLITISALGSGRIKVAEYGVVPPLLIVLFGLSIAILAPHVSRLLGRYDDDTVALGIEVSVRNVGIALLMIHFFFPGTDAQGHVLYTCLFYAGFSGFLAVPLVLLHRAGRSVVLLRRRHVRPVESR